jgi:hypothetical protein
MGEGEGLCVGKRWVAVVNLTRQHFGRECSSGRSSGGTYRLMVVRSETWS